MDTDLIAQAKSKAATLVSDAVHTAEDLVHKATQTAERLMDDSEERTTKALADALREVFGENQDARRFVDITRIPLICQSITGIDKTLTELKDMMEKNNENFVSQDAFMPIKYIVYGLVGMIMTGVIGALLTLVLRQ